MPLVSGSKTSTNAKGLQDTVQGLQYAPRGVINRVWNSAVTLASSTAETTIWPTNTEDYYGGRRIIGDKNNMGCATGFYAGALFRVHLYGTITNTGTPNLTVRLGLVDDGSNFEALGDTTATAMTTISGTGVFDIVGFIEVLEMTGSNNIRSWVEFTYNTTTVKSPRATFTVDLTQAYMDIDVRATWSASSASNAIAITGGYVEAL